MICQKPLQLQTWNFRRLFTDDGFGALFEHKSLWFELQKKKKDYCWVFPPTIIYFDNLKTFTVLSSFALAYETYFLWLF